MGYAVNKLLTQPGSPRWWLGGVGDYGHPEDHETESLADEVKRALGPNGELRQVEGGAGEMLSRACMANVAR